MPGTNAHFSYAAGDHSGEISSAALRCSHTGSGRSRTKVILSLLEYSAIDTVTHLPRRVHSHAAAALINFCEGVERDTLLPYLDPIVERLLKLLNAAGDPATVRRYVQEQAITTLAMVADASEATFGKVSRYCCPT